MAQSADQILQQLDAVISTCEGVRSRSKYDDLSDLKGAATSEVLARMQATIARLSPPGSSHRIAADGLMKQYGVGNGYAVGLLLGILRAMRADYAAGYFTNIAELIHADLFADFLEMSDHLLSQGYKDPAAVMTGSVLEEHLRKLCDKCGIPTITGETSKKADLLNAELAAASAYSKLDQKSVTAWLDLRNKAAHGKYSEYTKEQVQMLQDGVRHFMTRYPA
jgi:hypothetical protein